MTKKDKAELGLRPIKIRNCVFGFRCTENWSSMGGTNQYDVRFCASCEKEVYLVSTEADLMEAITLNRCVAIRISPMIDGDSCTSTIAGGISNYDQVE